MDIENFSIVEEYSKREESCEVIINDIIVAHKNKNEI